MSVPELVYSLLSGFMEARSSSGRALRCFLTFDWVVFRFRDCCCDDVLVFRCRGSYVLIRRIDGLVHSRRFG